MTPHIPDPLTPHPFDVFVFPIIDWDFRFQRPQHLATQFALRGHRVFYFDTDFLPDDCVFEPSPIPVAPNVWRWKLPGSLRPPNIFASLPTEGQLTAMLLGLRRLREVFEVGTTLCIVDYPFWWPLVQRLSNCVTAMTAWTTTQASGKQGHPPSNSNR